MKLFCLLIIVLTTSFVYNSPSHEISSTAEEREDLKIVIYQGNLAYITDSRKLELTEPAGSVRFKDVSPFLQPDSIAIHSEKPLTVTRCHYQPPQMQINRLLQNYIGKEVKVWKEDNNHILSWQVPFTAKLLGFEQGKTILEKDSQVFFSSSDNILLPDYDGKLNLRSLLRWEYEIKEEDSDEIRVSYLADGLDWKADYQITLPEQGNEASLQGWMTIDNKGTYNYPDARIQVIAGTIHRTRRPQPQRAMMDFAAARAESAPVIDEQPLYDYYSYSIPDRVSLHPQQSTQIPFMQTEKFDITREYLVISRDRHQYRSSHPEEEYLPVNNYLFFENTRNNNLGRPMPEGIVRFFQEDSGGERIFIGEDRILQTPIDETVRLQTGQAFDLRAQRRQTEYNRISQNIYETTWEVTLRNRKKEPVTMGVIENFPSSWTILDSSHEYTKVDAFTVRYDIDVPEGEEILLQYRVRIDYSR